MQLPGRGRRLSEAPFTELPSLLDAMDEGLRELTDRPYVLFGFSMGAILAFELALRRFAVFGPEGLESVVPQIDGNQFGNRRLVFDD
ncbi:thioesterase, partial [Verminephrobacter sp. Larva24]